MKVFVAVLALGGVALADPINLVGRHSMVINVGSTVANKSIRPEHIADGKLDTAWNSATNDLVGAWIVVRLPSDVTVSSIRLTAGFTKVDPKLGDLFTENPRIKKVRITHDRSVVDKDLDITSRTAQEVAITGGGGDYKIQVLAVEMGSKKTWREICVSELEVWGTGDPKRVYSHLAPEVYVNSFSPPLAIDDADCQTRFGPSNVSATATIIDERFAVCDNVSTSNPNDPFDQMMHAIQLVALPKKTGLGTPLETISQIHEGLGTATDTHFSLDTLVVGDVPLVITALASDTWSNLPDATAEDLPEASAKFVAYRATKDGLVDVLEVEGKPHCAFAVGDAPGKDGKSTTPELQLACGKAVTHFRWNGSKYVTR